MIGPGGAIEDAPEEGVEATHVIHVAMRQEKVIDGLRLGESEFRHAPLPAIEEQALDVLAGIDLHEQGVVMAGGAENAVSERHEGNLERDL